MPRQGLVDLLISEPTIVHVPNSGDVFEGLDGEQYRIHWISAFLPKRHAYLVRCAYLERPMGRMVDAGTYALITFDTDGHYREIEP